jgi:hypothetical protein
MALVCSHALTAHGMRATFEQTGGYIVNAEPMRADPESIVQIKGMSASTCQMERGCKLILSPANIYSRVRGPPVRG